MTRSPADEAVAEVPFQSCEGQLERLMVCSILLEPPAALIAYIGSTELLQQIVQDADVALCCHGRRCAIAALKPKWPDDATGALTDQEGELGAVKRLLFEG